MVRKVLSVAEKPSVAKELAAIISSGSASQRNGDSRFNKIFEFSCTLDGGPCQMLMTSVLGHLMEMDFEDQYKNWRGCDPASLFDAPVRMLTREDNSCAEVRRNLERAMRGCTELILWLDCDREGEAIGFEVIDVCRSIVPRLRVRRARFSALIPRDIHHALANLVAPDEKQSEAVLARSEIDLRLGAAFTRLQTLTLQHKFDGLDVCPPPPSAHHRCLAPADAMHSSFLAPHSSLLILHYSLLIRHTSFPTPHSSFLTPHSSLLIPHSSSST
jgi:DNA topoisomerase-3